MYPSSEVKDDSAVSTTVADSVGGGYVLYVVVGSTSAIIIYWLLSAVTDAGGRLYIHTSNYTCMLYNY